MRGSCALSLSVWLSAATRILCGVAATLALCALLRPILSWADAAAGGGASRSDSPHGQGVVVVLDMQAMILPGTQFYLEDAIREAKEQDARAIVIQLDTPGGLLQSAQEIVQAILRSPIPVFVYVGPSGASATSAGVFVTMAGHVAAMAPGTTIGAATPIQGDGKNIEGDLKAKAENITSAMVRTIAERRGRNFEWGEKAVKEAASATEQEALKAGVVDFVAADLSDLLRRASGKEVRLEHETLTLGDYSALPRVRLEMSSRNRIINVLANPNVLALLWLAATTGISVEIYSPGLIFPGIVGVICLLLALGMSQIIPVNQAALMLLIFGAALMGVELYTGTVLIGVGALVSMVIGAAYLVSEADAPGLQVSMIGIVSVAAVMGLFLLAVVVSASRLMGKRSVTGSEGLVGKVGVAVDSISASGQVHVNGEYWSAFVAQGVIDRGAEVVVVAMHPGLKLEVRKSELGS